MATAREPLSCPPPSSTGSNAGPDCPGRMRPGVAADFSELCEATRVSAVVLGGGDPVPPLPVSAYSVS